MKTALQTTLATLAPSICIQTLWERDPDCGPISKDCDGFTADDDDEWEAWQSEVRATAIVGGEEITGSAYLGGTWEKYVDNPAVSNPEISGYENQMTQEALEGLFVNPSVADHPTLGLEITAALEYLKAEARRSYDAQRAEIEATR